MSGIPFIEKERMSFQWIPFDLLNSIFCKYSPFVNNDSYMLI